MNYKTVTALAVAAILIVAYGCATTRHFNHDYQHAEEVLQAK